MSEQPFVIVEYVTVLAVLVPQASGHGPWPIEKTTLRQGLNKLDANAWAAMLRHADIQAVNDQVRVWDEFYDVSAYGGLTCEMLEIVRRTRDIKAIDWVAEQSWGFREPQQRKVAAAVCDAIKQINLEEELRRRPQRVVEAIAEATGMPVSILRGDARRNHGQ